MKSPYINEKTATEAGQQIARRLFEARGNNSEVHLKECELALIAKLAFEVGAQSVLKAMKRIE